MKTYVTDHWQINVPDEWVYELEEDAVLFYHPDSNGTLVISSVLEDEPITDDYLEDMVAEHLAAGADLYEETCGDFSGVSCCYDTEDEYWCEWFLYCDSIMMFVTYNCELPEAGNEDDVIDSMLESLSLSHAGILH